MMQPKAIGLWENPLRQSQGFDRGNAEGPGIEELFRECGIARVPAEAVVSAAMPGCYSVDARFRDAVMRSDWVAEGVIYPMNPSSLFAALAVDVQPGDEVLDLAAAPGGKSLVMAAALTEQGKATGRLALVEPIKARFHRMRANMQRCGVLQADYYQRDGRTVGAAVPERFDRVLLDAPCSSEARFHRDEPGSVSHWSLRKVRDCARKQKALLKSAFRALKPGGTLVYSTCSFSLEENERSVDGLLRKEPDAILTPVEVPRDSSDRFSPAITELPSENKNGGAMRKIKVLNCEHALRVLPDELWDGFFLAKIVKLKG
jgi:16S rRNA (cytosine1407-C5)-methyltransferase